MTDNARRDELVAAHGNLARSEARLCAGRGVRQDDLQQGAILAMLEAWPGWDEARWSFGVYMKPRIRRRLAEMILTAPAVHTSRKFGRQVARVKHAADLLRAMDGLEPLAADVGDVCGLDAATCRAALAFRPGKSAVESYGVASDDPDADDRAELLALVGAALGRCSEDGRAMLELVGVDGLSVRRAARRLGLTVKAARAAHDQAARAVASEFRALGWTAPAWQSAIRLHA